MLPQELIFKTIIKAYKWLFGFYQPPIYIFEEGILETQPFRPCLNIKIYLYKQNYCNILLKAPSMVCMEIFNHIFAREHGIN